MPITYKDKALLNMDEMHPAVAIDPKSRTAEMIRYGDGSRSIFLWTRAEALAMYKWYVIGYKTADIVDEFGKDILAYDFRELIKDSYYEFAGVISEDTIAKEWEQVQADIKDTFPAKHDPDTPKET